jgi:hypothetical protein
MSSAHDPLLAARAALAVLRVTLPACARPATSWCALLPQLNLVEEAAAAEYLASLPKPVCVIAVLAYAALCVAAWPASGIDADSWTAGNIAAAGNRPFRAPGALLLCTPSPDGAEIDLLLPTSVADQLLAEYHFAAAGGWSVSDPTPEVTAAGAVGVLRFYPATPGPSGWVALRADAT